MLKGEFVGLKRPELRSLEIVGLRPSRCLVGTGYWGMKGKESGFLWWIRTGVWYLATDGLEVSKTIGLTLFGGKGGMTEAKSESTAETRKIEAEGV